MTTFKMAQRAAVAIATLAGVIAYAPQVLGFPYEARFGQTVVRSERPLPADFGAILDEADALAARSPLYTGPVARLIFLTSGGWRWRLVALQQSGAVAFRRPLRNLIVVNDADPAADRARNHRAIGGIRTLHDVLAHETTHILITDHFGLARAIAFPHWKVEGYADHVAGASSVDDAQARQLRAKDPRDPGLAYYDARRRVEAALARDPSVDHLFLRP
ncbi:hypothetical protein [Sphingomonas crusticola]|uniref:hypothetical protein n=1 Tax=Sphingomonas crusticola TaxID=1697973 RepID=UPI000E25322C|nr:hypothetical protein [Sphingomonas crusticola]